MNEFLVTLAYRTSSNESDPAKVANQIDAGLRAAGLQLVVVSVKPLPVLSMPDEAPQANETMAQQFVRENELPAGSFAIASDGSQQLPSGLPMAQKRHDFLPLSWATMVADPAAGRWIEPPWRYGAKSWSEWPRRGDWFLFCVRHEIEVDSPDYIYGATYLDLNGRLVGEDFDLSDMTLIAPILSPKQETPANG